MRGYRRLFLLAWLLLIAADFAGLLYMNTKALVAHARLEELPMLYWVFLLLLPVLFFVPLLFWSRVVGLSAPDRRKLQTLMKVFVPSGIVFILMGTITNFTLPEDGAHSALFVMVGLLNLMLAGLFYQGLRHVANKGPV